MAFNAGGVANVGGAAASTAFPWLGAGAMGLGTLLGLFGSKQQRGPSPGELSQNFGANTLGTDWNQLYNMMKGGAGFQQALQQNALAGAQAGGSIQSNLMRHGISGASLIGSSLGGNLSALGEGALRGGLFNASGNLAQENLLARLNAWTSLKGVSMRQPSFMSQMGAGLLGAGGNAALGGSNG
jgi:hypothetical protein